VWQKGWQLPHGLPVVKQMANTMAMLEDEDEDAIEIESTGTIKKAISRF
jgi:hypothetical protein